MHKPIRYKQLFGHRYKKKRSWDLFVYLAKDIETDLRAFRMYNINSVPHKFVSDVDTSKDWDKTVETGMELWHETIDKMIWSFHEIANDHPNSPHTISWNKYWEEYGQYRKPEDWVYEKDGHTYYKSDDRYIAPSEEAIDMYNNKVKEGLHLFAEYFENLWD